MRDLPELPEMLEAVPIVKAWYAAGMGKPTLQQVTGGYVVEGWLIRQGYSLLGDGGASVSAQSIDAAKACCDLDAFVAEANAPTVAKIGDGELVKKWAPIVMPILLQLLRKWAGV